MCRPCALWYSPSVSRSPRTFFSNSSCYMSRNRNHFLHAQVSKTRLHTSSRSASPPGPPPQRQTMDVSGWHSKKDLSGVCQGLFKKRDEGGATQTKDWAVQFVEEPRRKEPLLRKEMSDAVFIASAKGTLRIGAPKEIDKAAWRNPWIGKLTPTSRHIRNKLASTRHIRKR